MNESHCEMNTSVEGYHENRIPSPVQRKRCVLDEAGSQGRHKRLKTGSKEDEAAANQKKNVSPIPVSRPQDTTSKTISTTTTKSSNSIHSATAGSSSSLSPPGLPRMTTSFQPRTSVEVIPSSKLQMVKLPPSFLASNSSTDSDSNSNTISQMATRNTSTSSSSSTSSLASSLSGSSSSDSDQGSGTESSDEKEEEEELIKEDTATKEVEPEGRKSPTSKGSIIREGVQEPTNLTNGEPTSRIHRHVLWLTALVFAAFLMTGSVVLPRLGAILEVSTETTGNSENKRLPPTVHLENSKETKAPPQGHIHGSADSLKVRTEDKVHIGHYRRGDKPLRNSSSGKKTEDTTAVKIKQEKNQAMDNLGIVAIHDDASLSAWKGQQDASSVERSDHNNPIVPPEEIANVAPVPDSNNIPMTSSLVMAPSSASSASSSIEKLTPGMMMKPKSSSSKSAISSTTGTPCNTTKPQRNITTPTTSGPDANNAVVSKKPINDRNRNETVAKEKVTSIPLKASDLVLTKQHSNSLRLGGDDANKHAGTDMTGPAPSKLVSGESNATTRQEVQAWKSNATTSTGVGFQEETSRQAASKDSSHLGQEKPKWPTELRSMNSTNKSTTDVGNGLLDKTRILDKGARKLVVKGQATETDQDGSPGKSEIQKDGTINDDDSAETTLENSSSSDYLSLVAFLPVCSRRAIADGNENSPQAQALRWLQEEATSREILPTWRKLQRFALACIYYSLLAGQVSDFSAIAHDRHECEWFREHDNDFRWFCNEPGEITYVSLSNRDLTGNLPPEIQLLSSLLVLDVRENPNIRGTIPGALGSLSNLVHLQLQGCGFRGPIPEELWKLSQLATLGLSGNMVGGTLPSEIGLLIGLRNIQMHQVGIQGSLPTEFGELVSLEHVSLSRNKLEGSIPDEVAKLHKLYELDLSSNLFSGFIPSMMNRLRALRVLLMEHNIFSGSLPAQLAYLKRLETLTLNDNRLSGDLHRNFRKLTNLSTLHLQNNNIRGTNVEELGNVLPAMENFRLHG